MTLKLKSAVKGNSNYRRLKYRANDVSMWIIVYDKQENRDEFLHNVQ